MAMDILRTAQVEEEEHHDADPVEQTDNEAPPEVNPNIVLRINDIDICTVCPPVPGWSFLDATLHPRISFGLWKRNVTDDRLYFYVVVYPNSWLESRPVAIIYIDVRDIMSYGYELAVDSSSDVDDSDDVELPVGADSPTDTAVSIDINPSTAVELSTDIDPSASDVDDDDDDDDGSSTQVNSAVDSNSQADVDAPPDTSNAGSTPSPPPSTDPNEYVEKSYFVLEALDADLVIFDETDANAARDGIHNPARVDLMHIAMRKAFADLTATARIAFAFYSSPDTRTLLEQFDIFIAGGAADKGSGGGGGGGDLESSDVFAADGTFGEEGYDGDYGYDSSDEFDYGDGDGYYGSGSDEGGADYDCNAGIDDLDDNDGSYSDGSNGGNGSNNSDLDLHDDDAYRHSAGSDEGNGSINNSNNKGSNSNDSDEGNDSDEIKDSNEANDSNGDHIEGPARQAQGDGPRA